MTRKRGTTHSKLFRLLPLRSSKPEDSEWGSHAAPVAREDTPGVAFLKSNALRARALQAVSPLPRQVFKLYRFGGMAHREIAAHLSLDLETVERCIGHVLATMVRFSDGDMTVPPLHPMVAEAEARQLRKGATDGHK